MTRVKNARELDEQLSELVDWKRFGVHLGMSKSEVDIIDRDEPDIANRKLTLFDKCLKADLSLNWEDVIEALEKIKENTLANKVNLAKLSCTKVSERETSLDHPAIVPVPVCSTIVRELAVLNKSFVAITENLKREIEIAFRNDTMTIKQIISRTTEEQAYIFSDDFWHVDNVYDFFKAIQPFYSFLDCYLIVCLASLFVSSTVEADEYEKKVESFKESTDVIDLCGVLEVYFPQSLDEGTNVRLTVVVQRSCGTQKIWLVEELIRVLFGLKKKECCQWFRVRPGSVVIDFLLPQPLMMFAIVQCVNKLEFLQLMGVIAIRVGTILVMRKTEDTKFSFQNSFIEACKLGKIKFVELLLRFSQVNVNKPSENMFLQQKNIDTELSFIRLLFELQVQFEAIASAFTTAIIENEMIELSSLMSCVNEQRPSIASFFSSVTDKSDFFSVAKYFITFLNVSFLVAIEKESVQLCSDVSFDLENYAERVESIKKAASFSCLQHGIQSKLRQKPPPSGTILTRIVLSREWRVCSISIIEKLVLNIFSILKSPDELQWFEISSESNKIVALFSFPESFQKQLIDSGKEKLGFMKSLGISVLKISEEVVLQFNCDIFSFKNAFLEAKQSNDVDVLKFLSEVQQDLLPMRTQGYFDENNNMTFECDPDSTALMISSAQDNMQLVKFLLDNGADPSIQTKTGATALLYAVYRGEYRIVQLLLEHNPHLVNICDLSEFSSLHVVCMLGNDRILKLLMKQKPDLNARSSDGITPLFIACYKLHVSLVSLLLKANVDPDIPDNNGTTPLSIAAQGNCLPIVQCLLKAHADPNLQNRFGVTSLYFAVENNNFRIFMALMDANADPCIETSFHASAFHLACQVGFLKMVKQILKRTKPDVRLSNGKTPLCCACDGSQIEIVKLLIKANANINLPFHSNTGAITPLGIACGIGNLKMVKLLIKAKADPNFQENEKTCLPALICAIQSNNSVIVNTLLEAKADPNARTQNLVTPLYIASLKGNMEIVNCLITAQANPNIQDVMGNTPLAVAIATQEILSISRALLGKSYIAHQSPNQYETVDALLTAGADPNIANSINCTPLHIAARHGMINIVIRLLKAKANPNIQTTEGMTPLHEATYFAHVEVIKILFKEKADPNILDYKNGMSPLHIACGADGSLEIAQVILSHSDADPNIFDGRSNETPLHFAALIVNPEVLQCLIASNANPDIKNQEGATPLHILCGHDRLTKKCAFLTCFIMVNILLEANADPNVQTSDGMLTPLHLACRKGSLEIVNSLLRAKADPNIQSSHELQTPLHYASIAGAFDIVSSLLKAKANPNIQDWDGSTPLVLLLMLGTYIKSSDDIEGLEVPVNQYEIVDSLLQAQADPNIANTFGCTPLFLAASGGKTDIVSRLLRRNANPNMQTKEGMMTPLYGATCNGHVEVIKVLLEEKADPNIFDYPDRMAPLHIACGPDGSLEIVQVILSCPNTNPDVLDHRHAAPIHFAVSSAQPKILHCLITSNANPNIRDSNGYTPLHIACMLACIKPGNRLATFLEIAGILLKAKADPHMDSKYGTAFQIAITRQNIHLLLVLFVHRNTYK